MKEITAAFQSEVFHPIATLVVPGFFTLFTLSIGIWQRHPAIQQMAEVHPALATTVTILVVLTAGLITEDLGARLEEYFDDNLETRDGYKQHKQQWYEYLRIAFDEEPVGHRYLKTLVLRLKFELGMAVASVFFAGGALYLETLWRWRALMAVAALLACLFFAYEAMCSNQTLSDLRRASQGLGCATAARCARSRPIRRVVEAMFRTCALCPGTRPHDKLSLCIMPQRESLCARQSPSLHNQLLQLDPQRLVLIVRRAAGFLDHCPASDSHTGQPGAM